MDGNPRWRWLPLLLPLLVPLLLPLQLPLLPMGEQ